MAKQDERLAALFADADEALARKDRDRAVELLTEALEIDPNHVPTLARLGKVQRLRRRYANALQLLEHAYAADPKNRDVLYELGIVARYQADPWRAVELHRKLVDLCPDDPNARHVLANDYTAIGQPNKAAPLIDALCEAFPGSDNYKISRAAMWIKAGFYSAAIDSMIEMLEAGRGSIDNFLLAGEAYRRRRDFVSWKALVRRAHEISDKSEGVQLAMHKICLHESDLDAAARHLALALERHPEFVDAQLAAGWFHWQLGNGDLAGKWFGSAAALAPWSGEAIGMQARFLAETGRASPDLEMLAREALDYPHSGLPLIIGETLLATDGNLDTAIQLLDLAARTLSEDPEAHRLLADAFILKGDFEAARTSFERGLAIAPDYDLAMIGKAFSSLETERYEEAAEAYGRAIEHRPADADLRYAHGSVLRHLGRREEAIAELREALRIDPAHEAAAELLQASAEE